MLADLAPEDTSAVWWSETDGDIHPFNTTQDVDAAIASVLG
ncbi:hypothetical protein ACFYNO_39820 [Kitasatospora sp. NPDC006697]